MKRIYFIYLFFVTFLSCQEDDVFYNDKSDEKPNPENYLKKGSQLQNDSMTIYTPELIRKDSIKDIDNWKY